MMANEALRHQGTAPSSKAKRSTQFAFKIRRNVFVIVDTSKGLLLGDEAVATRPGRPPMRGRVEAASPRSVVLVLPGGRKRRLSRSVWKVGRVVGTQRVRKI
jgi:hypothetical protein